MRSGGLIAKNDYLIEEIISSPLFRIFENGVIERNMTPKSTNVWKVVGKPDRENYKRIWWKDKRIFVHRIIYRKFKGHLEADLVIEHIDGDTSNNAISNLLLVTQKLNNEYKTRRRNRTGT